MAGWLVDWLVEHLIILEGMRWLLKQHLVLMGVELPVWIWIGLALAVILVLVAWWSD